MEFYSETDGLLLELALTIGENTGFDLLRLTMPFFTKKMNCNGTMVIKCIDDVDSVSSQGFKQEEQELLMKQAEVLYAGFPGTGQSALINGETDTIHIFQLSGFGLLALRFREIPTSGFIQKLLPVLNHLAKACSISEKLINMYSEKEQYSKERSLLHAVIQNIPDPVYVKDTEGRKIILNKAEAELLGKTDISEVIGQKDSDFYPESIALNTELEDQMIISSGKPVIHRDGILTTHGGKKIWVQGTKIPHFDENGKVTGIIGISHDISAYKQIENEVRVVAEKYQSIFNSFVDLYYRTDFKGIILELSPSVYQLAGYKHGELVGKPVTQIYADPERRNRMIELLIENGSVNDFENLLIHKSGEYIPVSITCHLVRESDGKPGFIEGTVRDISERKHADEKLKKLLNLQNLLTHLATEFINIPVENSNEAIGRLLSAIGKGNDIDRVYVFGYDFAKGTLSNTHEWCADDILPEIDNLQQISIELFPSMLELHKNGEMMMIPDVSKLDRNDPQYKIFGSHGVKSLVTIPLMLNGECLGLVGFDALKNAKVWSEYEIVFLQILADLVCNITDRKRKDEALQNREASLKAIFNNVPFQMWLKDVDSKYLAVNTPFMDYFSIAGEEDIIGKDAMDVWHDDVAVHFIEQDQLVMQNSEMSSVEELIDFKHKTAWFEIFRAPIIDQNGQLLGTTGIARDITSRKSAEETLRKAVETAEAATEAKSKYLAIMSHEIRNPLNAVVGMVRMLHEASMKGPENKLIENIKTSSDHLLMIVNDILDFSKIESGDMILEDTAFDIHDVVKRIFNSNVYIAREKQIDLNFSVDKQIGHAHNGDPLRLQQVLGNLVSNAIKFTQQGKIDIRCELEDKTEQSIRVRFEVQDSGIGINSENTERIFESFKQEDNTIARIHGGSGLGLAISKQIVELMGGTLSVESIRNVGSKFFFSIELKMAEAGSLQNMGIERNATQYSLKGYSILLVEDNKLNQILATTILEKWGARVVLAGNGQQAIEILANDSFNIILRDIQMPVMDGMTASKIIREELQLTTPILALSANVIKGIVEKCAEAGMQGYISKPFDSDDLYRKINSHISRIEIMNEKQLEFDPDIIVADVSRLEKMMGSDPVQLNIMLHKFLEITPAYLAELNSGDLANDLAAIAAASHKIKSSIDLVSKPVMRELILNINHSSREDGDLREVKPLIRQFNSYYKLLENQLREEIQAERIFGKVG